MTDPTGPATEVAEVVVYGRRIRYEYERPGWIEPPFITNPGDNDVINPEPPDGELHLACVDVSGMSDENKLRTLLRFAAAVALDQIESQPNQKREWAAAFFEQENEIRISTFVPTTDTQGRINWDDLPRRGNAPDYRLVRGFIHSHPCINLNLTGDEVNYFNSVDPYRLLRPSPSRFENDRFVGDWVSYDGIWGAAQQQGANLGGLMMYIAGCDGNSLQLNEFGMADHGYASTVDGTPGATDGTTGARGGISKQPLPPCSE